MNPEAAFCYMPYPTVEVPHAPDGPLSGLSFGVKDLFNVAGYPTSGGNPHVLALSGIKTRHAPTVARLLEAGARFSGKTITDELAFSMNGQNAHFGTPVNGAAPDRIPGGSSSGSASAVSNGCCDFALGTDTGGSVRAPASHCGLYGLRPTHGRISLTNALDLSPSLDTCGLFARTADVFQRVARVLLGDDTAQMPEKPKLLIAEDAFALMVPSTRAALAPALERLTQHYGSAEAINAAQPDFETLYWAFRHVQGYEAWQSDGALITRYGLALGPGVKERFAWSSTVTPAQYDEHSAIRASYRQWLADTLQDRVLVLPTMPDTAPKLSSPDSTLEDYRNQSTRMLCMAGLSGFPQVTIPGCTHEGAPIGLSLLGPAGSDLALIAMAVQMSHGAALSRESALTAGAAA